MQPAHEAKNYSAALRYTLAAVILFLLYLTTHVHYLLFHTLAELFSIVVATSLFMITWNSRRYIRNSYLLFVGIAYLYIGLIDLLHTLSYKGMPIFTEYDFYANQLWIAARGMESLTLLLGFGFLRSKRKINVIAVSAGYALVSALLILSIFYWKIFPECFIAGQGLTPFKKISEYVICGILLLALYQLKSNREKFEPKIYRMIFVSIICTIISELAFTFYVSNYGFSNLVGHYFKIFSFYLIYRAIIETSMVEPTKLIFRELDAANKRLKHEISIRKKTQEEREALIRDLSHALEEISTLRGIIPICSSCKKIRDDKGYWNQLESYISQHSDAEFTHGICPECAKKLYPDSKLLAEMDKAENGDKG